MVATRIEPRARQIIHRTFGHKRGPITRLVSPSDIGELIKPFVFLDLARFGDEPRMPMETLWHPHSGIATVTVMLDGGIKFAETTGQSGELAAGGVEWMRAGNGVWHTGEALPGETKVFQLWVALPPSLENAPNASHYVQPGDVPVDGPVRVILGEHGGMKSPIDAPPLTYIQVSLADGAHWSYQPPPGHDVAWLAVGDGRLRAASTIEAGELAVFEPSNDRIDLVAHGPTRFVLGSAAKHPHELWLGNYSVHTSREALVRGETEILRIGRALGRR